MLAVRHALSYLVLGTCVSSSSLFVACGESERTKGELPPSTAITATSTTGSGGDGGAGGEGGDGGDGGANPCANMLKDGDETDLDCGGTCPGCADGKICVDGTDCVSLVCLNGLCEMPACPDGVKNGAETDVDCGGMGCPRCDEGQGCMVDEDCTTLSCEAAVCAAPTCSDMAVNADETDVDCGGATCPKCADGMGCSVAADCVSDLCPAGTCLLTTCGNMMVDGAETDLDCGGPACLPCADFLLCAVDSDCASKKCAANGTCAAPSCTDQVQNGSETDQDCGGPNCPTKCSTGGMCILAADCQSSVCTSLVCQAPTCLDGVKNGTESAIDCGGAACPKCGLGQSCGVNTDCGTDACNVMSKTCDCPAKMIKVSQVGQGAYCMDATETTNEEYNAFLGNANNQLPECAWNVIYTPSGNWPYTPMQAGFPVRNVDWCDAYNYCLWKGKRLCGKVGGGANLFADYSDATLSEWYNACSANGLNVYPYAGVVFNEMACVDVAESSTTAVQMGGTPIVSTCGGGTVGLHHMSGNVREWENSCDAATGPTDGCRLRGGGFNAMSELEASCAADVAMPRNTALSPDGDDIGFRCCL